MLDILIVEDNKEIGELLQTFLRKENYAVSVAETGEKALELFERYGAKLVILDMFEDKREFKCTHPGCQCQN